YTTLFRSGARSSRACPSRRSAWPERAADRRAETGEPLHNVAERWAPTLARARSTAMRFHVVAVFAAFLAVQTPAPKTLDIYVVDVEGGNATLLVAPSRESLLIDS